MFNQDQIADVLSRAPYIEGALAVIFVDGSGARWIGIARTTMQADNQAFRAGISARKIMRATIDLPGGAKSEPFFLCHE